MTNEVIMGNWTTHGLAAALHQKVWNRSFCQVLGHDMRAVSMGIRRCIRCNVLHCDWCGDAPEREGKHHFCHVLSALQHNRPEIRKVPE